MQPGQVLSNLLEHVSSLLTPGCLQLTPLPSNVQYASSLYSLLKTESVRFLSGNLSKQVAAASSSPANLMKGSGKSQPVCIACIERWVGRVLLTKTSISVARAGWVGPAEVWFARTEPTDSWRQQRALLGEEVIRLQLMDAKSREAAGGKRTKSAVEAALNRGRQAGQIPRKPPQSVSAFCRDLFIAGQGLTSICKR
jgi:hypothetical protein